MHRLTALAPYLPLLTLWVAVFATSSLVLRELGLARLKKYPFTLLALAVSLLSLPSAAVVKLSRPYQRRIVAYLRREQSPAILGRGCPIFPGDNVWNTRAAGLPVDANSANYVASMNPEDPLHPDFGLAAGIPYTIIDGAVPPVQVVFGNGAGNSEPGPYPIPNDAPVEGGPDTHVLVMNRSNCTLYELFGASKLGPGRWSVDSAAIYDLRSNKLRPDGWTSADAAGTPILAGLARFDEVEAGRIPHALRFTTRRTRRAYVWPGRHYASASVDPHLPPMGQRFRLKANVDLTRFSSQARVILTALQEYGMILSDNGGNWYISGAPDSRWSSTLPKEFATLHGSDFEALDSSGMMVHPDSGQARQNIQANVPPSR